MKTQTKIILGAIVTLSFSGLFCAVNANNVSAARFDASVNPPSSNINSCSGSCSYSNGYAPPGGIEYASDGKGGWVESRDYGGGATITKTDTVTLPDGTTVTTVTTYARDCENKLWGEEITKTELDLVDENGEAVGGSNGGGCPCGGAAANTRSPLDPIGAVKADSSNARKPSPDRRPNDAPQPSDQGDIGYAVAEAIINESSNKTLDLSELYEDDGEMITPTPEEANEMVNGSSQANRSDARPHDRVAINTKAKSAYISGYTTNACATVTNDLDTGGNTYRNPGCDNGSGAGGNPEVKTNRSGEEVSVNHGERTIIAEDVGKVFTGTAYAKPLRAWLTFTPVYSSYIAGYTPVIASCSYQVTYACGTETHTDRDGNTTETTIYCERTVTCSYIAGWNPIYASYISGWTPHYNESGEASKKVEVRVPHNYDVEIPPIVACDTEGNPPCAGWPNYGITYPGEDREFQHRMAINTANGYATNTRPSTYEIVSFVTTPDSGKPGGPGDGAFRSSTPSAGDSCPHYTAGTSLARGCVVVQRHSDIYFNTANNVNTGGKTDTSAYDIAGNEIEKGNLNPNIVIDDLPAGSKICVAISVWPNDVINKVDREFNGSTWLHGSPYCLTIAKKPSTQFWGAGVFSAGDIVSSQSVKYVPSDKGFTASGSHNGLSTIDTARRAFGSWSEYDAISNRNIKGLATGAALGYNPLGTSTIGGNFNSMRPGGFPTNFKASNSFTKDRLCSYSSQTLANGINTECRDSYTMGNANIANANIDLTLDRLISRYAATSDNTSNEITINGGSPHNDSADGKTQSYSSSATDVTLRTNGAIPKGNTLSVTVPGKLTIASDIRYEDTEFTNISDLPQVIIFADSIDILPGVSRVDAWLVVGQRNSSQRSDDSGILNTCTGFQIGATGINDCNTNSLEVNGPVFVEKLALNRTAGANAGYASIQPAERFNLRADSFLWSYAQAQRYSQAVVTYSRELAPRY